MSSSSRKSGTEEDSVPGKEKKNLSILQLVDILRYGLTMLVRMARVGHTFLTFCTGILFFFVAPPTSISTLSAKLVFVFFFSRAEIVFEGKDKRATFFASYFIKVQLIDDISGLPGSLQVLRADGHLLRKFSTNNEQAAME